MTHFYKRSLKRKLWLCTGLAIGMTTFFSQAYANSDHDKCNDACIQSMSRGLEMCSENFPDSASSKQHHCFEAMDAGEAACKGQCGKLFSS